MKKVIFAILILVFVIPLTIPARVNANAQEKYCDIGPIRKTTISIDARALSPRPRSDVRYETVKRPYDYNMGVLRVDEAQTGDVVSATVRIWFDENIIFSKIEVVYTDADGEGRAEFTGDQASFNLSLIENEAWYHFYIVGYDEYGNPFFFDEIHTDSDGGNPITKKDGCPMWTGEQPPGNPYHFSLDYND